MFKIKSQCYDLLTRCAGYQETMVPRRLSSCWVGTTAILIYELKDYMFAFFDARMVLDDRAWWPSGRSALLPIANWFRAQTC